MPPITATLPAASNGPMCAYGNGMFLRLISGGCERSLDGGLTWEALANPAFTPESLKFGNGIFAAVAGRAKVKISTDGTSWVYKGPDGSQFCSLAYGNGVWVMVETGRNGKNTAVSFDNWETFTYLSLNRPSGGNPSTPTLAFCGGAFIQGQYGMYSSYDWSFDGVKWFQVSGLPYYIGNDTSTHKCCAELNDVGLVVSSGSTHMLIVQSKHKKVITE